MIDFILFKFLITSFDSYQTNAPESVLWNFNFCLIFKESTLAEIIVLLNFSSHTSTTDVY